MSVCASGEETEQRRREHKKINGQKKEASVSLKILTCVFSYGANSHLMSDEDRGTLGIRGGGIDE